MNEFNVLRNQIFWGYMSLLVAILIVLETTRNADISNSTVFMIAFVFVVSMISFMYFTHKEAE